MRETRIKVKKGAALRLSRSDKFARKIGAKPAQQKVLAHGCSAGANLVQGRLDNWAT